MACGNVSVRCRDCLDANDNSTTLLLDAYDNATILLDATILLHSSQIGDVNFYQISTSNMNGSGQKSKVGTKNSVNCNPKI